MRNKAKAHRIIANIADDADVLAALDDLTDNPMERAQAAADPEGWAKGKTLEGPQGARVFFDENNWAVGVQFDVGDSTFTIGYSSTDGVFASKST
jgi:hypothetical protein